jgi:hypothetical protein
MAQIASMTDPADALTSFQQALSTSGISPQRCKLHNSMFVFVDAPKGTHRFTYVMLDGTVVRALAMFAECEPINDKPCMQLGYAVPNALRNQGRAKQIVELAINEMKHGFASTQMDTLFIEAIVGIDNEASKRVATATSSNNPEEVTDSVSGLPALRYLREVKIRG